MWDNSTGDKNLWVVKRQNADIYETGYYSYVAPKVFTREGDARRVANKNNRFRQSAISGSPDPEVIRQEIIARSPSYYGPGGKGEKYIPQAVEYTIDNRKKEIELGPWIVVPVKIVPLSIEEQV